MIIVFNELTILWRSNSYYMFRYVKRERLCVGVKIKVSKRKSWSEQMGSLLCGGGIRVKSSDRQGGASM